MATIVTRASKGSALTWQEGDANIENLNTFKLEDITQESIGDLQDVDTSSISSFDILMWDSNLNKFVAATSVDRGGMGSGGGSSPLTGTVISIDDQRSPKTITLSPDPNLTTNDTITFSGTDVTSAGLDSNQTYYIWASVSNGEYEISEDNLTVYNGLINFGAITDLQFSASSGGMGAGGGSGPFGLLLNDLGDVSYASAMEGNVLTFNSASNSWTAQSPAPGGLASISEDTTPQLGGDLVVGNFKITNTNDSPVTIQTQAGFGGNPNTSISLITEQQYIKILESVGDTRIAISSSQGVDLEGSKLLAAQLENYKETVYSIGTTSGTVAPNAANGNVQTITLNGNLTLNAFTSPAAGQSITLIVNTNGTGRTLTSSMKWAGGDKTLSDTNTTDIISVFYDGTNYWASLSKGFE